MGFVIWFTSDKFDLAKEDPNPINPFHGQSLLQWIRQQLDGRYEVTEPDYEDWGWYSDIDFEGRSYMLGAHGNEAEGTVEWALAFDKHRTLWEKLTGKATMTDDDPCFAFILDLIRKQPDFANVDVE